MSARYCATTANEAHSAMKQASPVRPLDAQRIGCSGVVDTTTCLQQAKVSEVPTQPLSSDRPVFEERVGMAGARSGHELDTCMQRRQRQSMPLKVRIDENANEVVEIRAEGRGRPVNESDKYMLFQKELFLKQGQ